MAKYEVTIGGKTWHCDTLSEARALEKKHAKVKNGDEFGIARISRALAATLSVFETSDPRHGPAGYLRNLASIQRLTVDLRQAIAREGLQNPQALELADHAAKVARQAAKGALLAEQQTAPAATAKTTEQAKMAAARATDDAAAARVKKRARHVQRAYQTASKYYQTAAEQPSNWNAARDNLLQQANELRRALTRYRDTDAVALLATADAFLRDPSGAMQGKPQRFRTEVAPAAKPAVNVAVRLIRARAASVDAAKAYTKAQRAYDAPAHPTTAKEKAEISRVVAARNTAEAALRAADVEWADATAAYTLATGQYAPDRGLPGDRYAAEAHNLANLHERYAAPAAPADNIQQQAIILNEISTIQQKINRLRVVQYPNMTEIQHLEAQAAAKRGELRNLIRGVGTRAAEGHRTKAATEAVPAAGSVAAAIAAQAAARIALSRAETEHNNTGTPKTLKLWRAAQDRLMNAIAAEAAARAQSIYAAPAAPAVPAPSRYIAPIFGDIEKAVLAAGKVPDPPTWSDVSAAVDLVKRENVWRNTTPDTAAARAAIEDLRRAVVYHQREGTGTTRLFVAIAATRLQEIDRSLRDAVGLAPNAPVRTASRLAQAEKAVKTTGKALAALEAVEPEAYRTNVDKYRRLNTAYQKAHVELRSAQDATAATPAPRTGSPSGSLPSPLKAKRPKGAAHNNMQRNYPNYLCTFISPKCNVPVAFYADNNGEFAGFSPDNKKYFGHGYFEIGSKKHDENGCRRQHMPGLENYNEDQGTGIGAALYMAGPFAALFQYGETCTFSPKYSEAIAYYGYRSPEATAAWDNLESHGTAEEELESDSRIEIVSERVDVSEYFSAGDGQFEDWTSIDEVNPSVVRVSGEREVEGDDRYVQEISLKKILRMAILLDCSPDLWSKIKTHTSQDQLKLFVAPAEVLSTVDWENTPAAKINEYALFCAEETAIGQSYITAAQAALAQNSSTPTELALELPKVLVQNPKRKMSAKAVAWLKKMADPRWGAVL